MKNRYQKLTVNFFNIIRERKLSLSSAFLLVYLRGLACYFQKPQFGWEDKKLLQELGITRWRLQSLRKELVIKGLISIEINRSACVATQYTMLDTIIADISVGVYSPHPSEYSPHLCKKSPHSIYKSNVEKEVRRIGVTANEILEKFK